MSNTNKTVVEKFLDAYNQGALDSLDELVSPNYIHHNNDNRLNLAQFKRGAAWVRTGMPDYRVVIDDMVSEGDKVAVRFTGRGTHLGSFYDETPTQKSIVVYGINIYRLENNRIVEDWEAMDEHDFMKQLGALPKQSQ